MANLGTLWFGADIDLTALKQKIQQGNQSILSALKMDYDPASYQQMVSKLKSQLDKETFNIKVTTNAAEIQRGLQSTLQSLSSSTSAPKLDLTGLKGISGMSRDILEMRDNVFILSRAVQTLKQQWIATSKAYGENSKQALYAKKQYQDANTALQTMRVNLSGLTRDRGLASLAQRELNKQTHEAAKAARQWNSDHMRLNATLAGGIHVSTQLGSALSSLFALDAARQFLGNVIEIGGQLEKQRISIAAILGDTVKATHLFEQIKGLALKSPFGVVELDQYTKQLSAYGFKYNELYDMTKRLADISAGAGTDIGRLTLALGHVRSATYLTGITLRQFSMNNIPMLKMLADYYTEVEKKAVSTADVQKRISKRQVSYEDVIEQIRRLTNEGGMFYNMQEKISESVAARFKNLRDAMDIMYGEIAEGTVGDMLKGLASILLKTTRHWKEIAYVMGVAAAAFVIGKARIGFATVSLQGNTAATIKQIMATKQLSANNLRTAATYRTLTSQEKIAIASANSLTVADIKQAMAMNQLAKSDVLRLVALRQLKVAQAMHLVGINGITAAEIRAAAAAKSWKVTLSGLHMSLKNAFAGVGWGTWTTLGLMAGTAIYSAWDQWNERIDEKSKEMKDLIKSRIIDLEKMQKTIDTEGKPKDQTALKGRVDEMKQVLANSESYTKTLDEQLGKSKDLSGQYDILATEIGKVAEKNRQMVDYQDRIAKMIKASTGDFWSTSYKENLEWFFNDDITKNMSQTLDAYKDLRATIDAAWEYKEAIKSVIEEMANSGEISKDFADQIKSAPFEEQIRLLAESGYWQQIKDKVTGMKPDFLKFADGLVEASNKVTKRWDEIANDDIPRMMKKEAENRGISEKELKEWALNNIDDFRMMLDGINDQLGLKEPEVRRRLKRLFYDYVRFGDLAQQLGGDERAKGMAYAMMAGASLFSGGNLERLLKENDLADIKDEGGNGPDANGNKKDAALEAARTKLAEYKAFLTEYKKYREMYDKEKAINLLEKLFPNLKNENGKFLGTELVDKYSEALAKLRDSLKPTTEERKKFINEINKTDADTLFDREQETLKKNAEAMEEYTKKMTDQWKLYRSLLSKSGGNQSFASLAFNEGTIWDETAKKMLERFNQRGAELGVIPVGFDWKMNEDQLKKSLVNAEGQVQTELVNLAKEIKKVITGNYTQFLQDSADAYSKSLTASQKLVELERQRNELIKKRDNDNDQSSEKRQGWDAQIGAINKQIAEQKWEAFKETEQWGRIFANLDNISTSTLENLLEKLQVIVPQLNLSAEATKAVYEAMDKIQDKLNDRNPFAAIFASVQQGSRLRQLYKSLNGGSYTATSEKYAKYYGLQQGKAYTSNEIKDLIKKAGSDFVSGLEGLSAGFKAVQDVLSPVVNLFEQLGDSSLANLFGMGSNALGAAAQVAGGLNVLGLEAAGPWGAAAGAALSVISSVVAMHDESLQKEIEASKARQKEMENLTKNLETALERALGGIYNTKAGSDVLDALTKEIANPFKGLNIKGVFGGLLDTDSDYRSYIGKDTIKAVENAEKTKSYYDAAYASLLAQRDELQHQMQAEEDKKDSDSERIADYKQQIIEMQDEIDNFAKDMAKNLWDIDVKSWAKTLTETIVDAWKKGEDAVDAYKNKVREMMLDLTTNILSQKIMEKALEEIGLDDLIANIMKSTKGELDVDSVEELADALNSAGENSAKAITAILDSMEMKGYLSRDEETKSSSASSSIKGITEQTADLLASYVNAIRADLSVVRGTQAIYLPSIATAVQHTSAMADIQVMNLQQIADNTRRNADAADKIYDIMHKIDTGVTAIKMK